MGSVTSFLHKCRSELWNMLFGGGARRTAVDWRQMVSFERSKDELRDKAARRRTPL